MTKFKQLIERHEKLKANILAKTPYAKARFVVRHKYVQMKVGGIPRFLLDEDGYIWKDSTQGLKMRLVGELSGMTEVVKNECEKLHLFITEGYGNIPEFKEFWDGRTERKPSFKPKQKESMF